LLRENPTLGILTNFHFKHKAEGLIHLANFIKRTSPESALLIGGNGQFFEEYKKKILAIHPNTTFLGHCKKEDLFRQIDIFTYCSMQDNQPLAVLEAMAHGLPIVCNNIGAADELLRERLDKYLAKDNEQYESILKMLINSEQERKTCAKLAQETAKKYSWGVLVERFISLYQ
jgi:glycosyltransferase involved in cell wall biosynthesis